MTNASDLPSIKPEYVSLNPNRSIFDRFYTIPLKADMLDGNSHPTYGVPIPTPNRWKYAISTLFDGHVGVCFGKDFQDATMFGYMANYYGVFNNFQHQPYSNWQRFPWFGWSHVWLFNPVGTGALFNTVNGLYGYLHLTTVPYRGIDND